jgi:hypothetical protein
MRWKVVSERLNTAPATAARVNTTNGTSVVPFGAREELIVQVRPASIV